eukprot:1690-Heterococcus_DN1.PRE.3
MRRYPAAVLTAAAGHCCWPSLLLLLSATIVIATAAAVAATAAADTDVSLTTSQHTQHYCGHMSCASRLMSMLPPHSTMPMRSRPVIALTSAPNAAATPTAALGSMTSFSLS